MKQWVRACAVDDIELEDVRPFEYAGRAYALYRSPDNRFFATAGLCSHERAYLAEGFVMQHIIECPRHNGRFDYRTGAAKGAPACIDLKTFPVKVEAGFVFIELDGS